MKKRLLFLTGLLTLSLTCGCSSKPSVTPPEESMSSPVINDIDESADSSFLDQTPSSEADSSENTAPDTATDSSESQTEESSAEEVPVSLTVEEQIELIQATLPVLLGSHSSMTVTDLDGNGRIELILAEPDFLVYEVSEDGTSLQQTVMIDENTDNCPAPYGVGNQLLFKDKNGVRHYIWRGYTSIDEDLSRDYENEYIYVNGSMMCENLRTITYSVSDACEDVYSYGMEYMTQEEYANTLKELCESGDYTLQRSTMEWDYSAYELLDNTKDILPTLTRLYQSFSVEDATLSYTYQDLEGSYLLTSGSVEGSDFILEPEEQTSHLVFHDGLVDYVDDNCNDSVNTLTANLSTSLCFGSHYENDDWYLSLPDNEVFRYGTVTFTEDGRLVFIAQLMYTEEDYASVLWYFEKE